MSNQTPITIGRTQRDVEVTDSQGTTKLVSPSTPTMEDALMGTDPPIEKAHPGLQPALVFASYPIVLIVLITCLIGYFALFRSKPSITDVRPNQSEVAK